MPAWLVSFLLSAVLKFGIPLLLSWLKKKFPSLPLDNVAPVLEDYVKEVREAKGERRAATRRAKRRLRENVGLFRPSDIKEN